MAGKGSSLVSGGQWRRLERLGPGQHAYQISPQNRPVRAGGNGLSLGWVLFGGALTGIICFAIGRSSKRP